MKPLSFIIALLLSFPLIAQKYKNPISRDGLTGQIDNLAGTYLGKENGALAIGFVKNGKQQILYYGKKSEYKEMLPDSADIFEIGELTETFTSILLADKAINDEMRIDGSLGDYLKKDVPSPVYQPFVCKPIDLGTDNDYFNNNDDLKIKFRPIMCLPDSSSKPQPVLLCYLATHTSGYPDLPFNIHSDKPDQPFADYSQDDLYKFLREFVIEDPIGFNYKYSRLGIALLGEAISVHMKSDFESILVKSVLDSLNMSDTRIKLDSSQLLRILDGYDKNGSKMKASSYLAFAPVSGLHSTPNDMMKFLAANISVKKDHIANVLDYTHNPRIKPGADKDDLEIALGWKINALGKKGDRMVWKGGLTNGFGSFVGFSEINHTGVFILSSKGVSTETLGKELMKLLSEESAGGTKGGLK